MNTAVCDPGLGLATANENTKLAENLHFQLKRQVRGFKIVYAGDGIILQGQAQTYYAKQLAQHAVMKVIEKPILANEIEVS